ncbi:unnamed protein product [Rhodiola kirilowii]
MDVKKIIAICQSGGTFEKNQDGSLSYTGGEAFAVDLDEHTKLTEFKREVAEMFGFKVTSIIIKYFLRGNKKTLISIAKEKDLKRMIKFTDDSGTVDVFILSEEPPGQQGNPSSILTNMLSSRTTGNTTAEMLAIDNAPVDVGDVVPIDKIDENHANGLMDIDITIQSPTNALPIMSHFGTPRRAEWGNAITGVDQRFDSFKEFRDALHKYSVAHGFAYVYKKKESRRVTVVCKAKGCPWRICASKLPTTELICIKKMQDTHTCEGTDGVVKYRKTSSWVGKVIKEKLKVSPNYKPKDVAEYIEREYGVKLNYAQARRAKEVARELLQGSYKGAYNQLPYFCEKIKETNPGSCATFSTKEDSSFHRLFISFNASIIGFQNGCRPLLFLESYPSNTKYQEVVLAATATDGDDGAFPVAFGIVDIESDDNWDWFLAELKAVVSTSRQITFVADSDKGLKESIDEVFEKSCYHAYCVRYLAEKLNDDMKGKLSYDARRLMTSDFYGAAYAAKHDAFELCVKNIKRISHEAHDWVMNSEPKHWANALFEGARYNHLTANFGQEFYSWVAEAREMTITQIVDILRGKIMEAIYERRLESMQWMSMLTPSMEDRLHKETAVAETLHVSLLCGNTYQVRGNESDEVVDIEQYSCSCRGWHLTGLPCSHAIAVLKSTFGSLYNYCSGFFTVESYRLTYAESIQPVPNVDIPSADESNPETVVTVTPPSCKRPRGRPKIKQDETIDIKRQMQCSKCKSFGHNKRKCQVPSTFSLAL